jgi:hypothetical protein
MMRGKTYRVHLTKADLCNAPTTTWITERGTGTDLCRGCRFAQGRPLQRSNHGFEPQTWNHGLGLRKGARCQTSVGGAVLRRADLCNAPITTWNHGLETADWNHDLDHGKWHGTDLSRGCRFTQGRPLQRSDHGLEPQTWHREFATTGFGTTDLGHINTTAKAKKF